MIKISRYILIVISILTLAVFIPNLYWTAFEKPNKSIQAYYSCIIDDFTLYDYSNDTREDAKGKQYSKKDYERLLPLLYYRQLVIDKNMPDSIKGVEVDIHEFMKHRSYVRIKPSDINRPITKLYPLFDAESGRANLELPEDVFRINWRVEFINCNTNTIYEEKSRLFSAALYHHGFEFPSKQIAGLPTTRKSCDEGYFIVDNNDQLFHLKMIKGKPNVKHITTPKELKFRFIECVDFTDKKYYAHLITNDNKLYILTQDNYEFIKWPIENYNADIHEMKITGDFFNYNITLKSDSDIQCIALDKDYEIVKKYYCKWLPNSQKRIGKIDDILFPFSIKLKNENSRFIKCYYSFSDALYWIIISLVLAVTQFFIMKKKKKFPKKQLIDILFILATGIYGFIAVNIFPSQE